MCDTGKMKYEVKPMAGGGGVGGGFLTIFPSLKKKKLHNPVNCHDLFQKLMPL